MRYQNKCSIIIERLSLNQRVEGQRWWSQDHHRYPSIPENPKEPIEVDMVWRIGIVIARFCELARRLFRLPVVWVDPAVYLSLQALAEQEGRPIGARAVHGGNRSQLRSGQRC